MLATLLKLFHSYCLSNTKQRQIDAPSGTRYRDMATRVNYEITACLL